MKLFRSTAVLLACLVGISHPGSVGVSASTTGETSEAAIPADTKDFHYYYSRLSEEEQLIYDALLQCTTSDDPTATGDPITVTTDPSSEEFHEEFRKVYNALLYEQPALFWLGVSGSSFEFTYRTKWFQADTYSIAFRLPDVPSDRKEMLAKLEQSSEELLSLVDQTQSEPQIALQIHDLLLEKVTYNSAVSASSTSDLAHTAYGALVADSSGNPKSAVCDGYTLAYEYLLQKSGIPCIMVAGHAGDDRTGAGSHSWNLVQLDGDWYEVDVTWDDLSLSSPDGDDYSSLSAQALRDEAYVNKLHHFMFARTTEEITNFVPDESYRYKTAAGWVSFLGNSVHIRYTEEDSAATGDYMTPLAPAAEGTAWTYEAILQQIPE